MNEFELIRRYFAIGGSVRDDVVLGIGDDAAVLNVPSGQELVVTTDSLVSGVHFPENLDAEAIGHRALAVNLSDLAAMGAEPAWVALALTLPDTNEAWLEGFSRGFFKLAKQHNVVLIGGNVARGPLNITVTAHGLVPVGQAIRRSGAQPGDVVFVTGHPGDAAAGLELIRSGRNSSDNPCMQRFCYPAPRVEAGVALRGIASAMIDVSDGLLADLSHLLESSGAGASLQLANLPLSDCLLEMHSEASARQLGLTGGDDYELCFTAHPDRVAELQTRASAFDCTVTGIGIVGNEPGIRCVDEAGDAIVYTETGYTHF